MHDYIIVGAGSAGCVLANRLSEDTQANVLLLEAGESDRSYAIRVPAAASLLYKGPYDWAFETEPQSCPQRSPDVFRARERAGRLKHDQLDDLYARRPARL